MQMKDLTRPGSRGVAAMATAIGAFAVGAFAIGAFAIGRLVDPPPLGREGQI